MPIVDFNEDELSVLIEQATQPSQSRSCSLEKVELLNSARAKLILADPHRPVTLPASTWTARGIEAVLDVLEKYDLRSLREADAAVFAQFIAHLRNPLKKM